MTNNMADHHPGNSVAEGNHEGDFGCSMVELRNLMELRSAEAVARLNDSYGGVQNVCKRLKTSPVEGKRPSCEEGPPARVRLVPLGWSTQGSRWRVVAQIVVLWLSLKRGPAVPGTHRKPHGSLQLNKMII